MLSKVFRQTYLFIGFILATVNISYTQVYDLALVLEVTSNPIYMIGEDVNYTITVCNQGDLIASNIDIVNYIPTEMGLSTSDFNGWSGSGPGMVTNSINRIPAGVCTTLEIQLTIESSVSGAQIINHAEIMADNGSDIDSQPDLINGNDAGGAANTPSDNMMFGSGTGIPGDGVASTDEDDHDAEMITILGGSLTLEKISDQSGISSSPQEGEFISYSFSVCNTGTGIISNLAVSDPLVSITGLPISLQPGACNESVFSGMYAISNIDIQNGSISNTATVTGIDLSGQTISASATEIAVFEADGQPAIPVIETDEGDVHVSNALHGLILTSPDGSCYRIRVENGGTLHIAQLSCP